MMTRSQHAEILRSLEESKAQIRAAMINMHETVLVSRALVEVTCGWLREMDKLFPAR